MSEFSSESIPASAYEGILVALRPVGRADYPLFLRWRVDITELHLWRNTRLIPTLEQFAGEMERMLKQTTTLIAVDKRSRLPLGFLQAYNFNLKDGWCFFQVHFEREQRGNDSCAEAGVALLDYVFRNFDVRKIYMDVYDLNREVLGRALTQASVKGVRLVCWWQRSGELLSTAIQEKELALLRNLAEAVVALKRAVDGAIVLPIFVWILELASGR